MNRSAVHTIREELMGVAIFVGTIWGVFLLDSIPGVPLKETMSLVPRTVTGLVGIVTMPFLHKDLSHLMSNTLPLVVLLGLLAGSRANTWYTVAALVFVSGSLLWLFAFPRSGLTAHVGASGLIFSLITFLIASGYFERRPVPLLIAVLVGVMYGTTLLFGIIPGFQSGKHVSWDGHLWGAVAGIAVAYMNTILPTLRESGANAQDNSDVPLA
ncbi:MAG: rhomboid family intramembrane serine protease [Pirellulaceae bacterium]|nr:rhomboid family intramembrane serine protease [Planctomycetales bacterium]